MARSPISRSTIVAGLLAGIFGIAAGRAEAWPWPWVNPEIHNSGAQVTGAYYDPFTGRWVIRTDRTRVRESFLDPHRLHVDPGSKHYVDTIQVDAHGVQWRVFGWKWTSHGVPHGDVRRFEKLDLRRRRTVGACRPARRRGTPIIWETARRRV